MAIHSALDTHGHAGHAHHWEHSWAPAAISVGALFFTLAFSMFFVYDAKLPAIVFAGISAPLVLIGIAKWMSEMGQPTVPALNSLGLTLFIFGEILIFLGLFASYWTVRISAGMDGAAWPPAGTPELNHVLPLIMTAILVTSSFTYHHAEKKFEEGEGGATFWLLVSIVLGAAFVSCTAYEYTNLWGEGFKPGTNQYSAAFYSLTGFHATHVIVGLCGFLAVLLGSMFGKVHQTLVKSIGVYWHFVDIVWFFVASQVYFW
jgi:cytochrome c oxidase subunit 3